MKTLTSLKSVLCLALVLCLASCSSNDANKALNESAISVTINGTSINFENLNHGPVSGAQNNTLITGTAKGNAQNSISFAIIEKQVGSTALYSFELIYNGKKYSGNNSNFNASVTVNDNSVIQGTFSGKVEYVNNGAETLQLSGGIFEVFL